MRFLNGDTLSSRDVTVPVGTIVVWTNQSHNDLHTVTFAPVGQPFPTLNPFGLTSGGWTYDSSTLVNSGILAPARASASPSRGQARTRTTVSSMMRRST
jgi:plastocyanin